MLSHFEYRNGELYCENVPVAKITESAGTPVYIYSRNAFLSRWEEINRAFSDISHTVCYSVKTNPNLSILRSLAQQGCGFDIVSGGELYRVLKVGGDPKKIVFAGVGKTVQEIEDALNAGILMFNVESESELQRINDVAGRLGKEAPVAFRINPDVDPKTHKHTTTGKAENKFGMDFDRTAKLISRLSDFPHIRLIGAHMHLGSPINTIEPYAEALDKFADFIRARSIDPNLFQYINTGGGFGIDYIPGQSKSAAEYASAILPRVKALNARLVLEPGRFISGNSGILVAEIQYVKDSGPKRFYITNGGMNDLIRPALYDSFHEIWPVRADVPPPLLGGSVSDDFRKVDVVGPVCESGDFFAKNRKLPHAESGDLLAVFSAGAYGASMSSRYNQRPLPAEVTVDGDDFFITRRRETYDDMMEMETIPDSWK